MLAFSWSITIQHAYRLCVAIWCLNLKWQQVSKVCTDHYFNNHSLPPLPLVHIWGLEFSLKTQFLLVMLNCYHVELL